MEELVDLSPGAVLSGIDEWYRPERHLLITVAAYDTGTNLEVRWIFSEHGKKNVLRIFRSFFEYSATLPTITRLIPSAWLVEREIADLFGVAVAGALPGVMLDPDSRKAPLRRSP